MLLLPNVYPRSYVVSNTIVEGNPTWICTNSYNMYQKHTTVQGCAATAAICTESTQHYRVVLQHLQHLWETWWKIFMVPWSIRRQGQVSLPRCLSHTHEWCGRYWICMSQPCWGLTSLPTAAEDDSASRSDKVIALWKGHLAYCIIYFSVSWSWFALFHFSSHETLAQTIIAERSQKWEAIELSC